MLYVQVHLTLPAWIHDVVDVRTDYADDKAKMRLAIALARSNVEYASGGPFGAAIFNAAGRIAGVGVNRVVTQNCSVAHAEMMAFMTAQQRLQRFRLNADGGHYTLATSAQPCCQCYGATVWAGIDRLVIGASSDDVHELTEFDEGPLPADWVGELERRGVTVVRDVARDEARQVLADYAARGGTRY